MKKCKKESCEKTVEGRKQYCSDSCKYWHNQIRKDNERLLPPVKKRSENFFYMDTGATESSLKSRGQGRRSGHMVKGAMAAIIYFRVQEIVPVTLENINKHFHGNAYKPTHAKLGNGEIITEDEILKRISGEHLS